MRTGVLILLLVAGCKNIPSESPEAEPEAPATAKSEAAPVPGAEHDCATRLKRAEQDYIRGRELVEEARDGEHYKASAMRAALDLLEDAGRRGSVRAHSLFGRRQFEFLFLNQAPQPSERELYVRALRSLVVAARASDPDAADYMPGLTDLRVENGSLRPVALPDPLGDIPREWLIEAVELADKWESCDSKVEWV